MDAHLGDGGADIAGEAGRVVADGQVFAVGALDGRRGALAAAEGEAGAVADAESRQLVIRKLVDKIVDRNPVVDDVLQCRTLHLVQRRHLLMAGDPADDVVGGEVGDGGLFNLLRLAGVGNELRVLAVEEMEFLLVVREDGEDVFILGGDDRFGNMQLPGDMGIPGTDARPDDVVARFEDIGSRLFVVGGE